MDVSVVGAVRGRIDSRERFKSATPYGRRKNKAQLWVDDECTFSGSNSSAEASASDRTQGWQTRDNTRSAVLELKMCTVAQRKGQFQEETQQQGNCCACSCGLDEDGSTTACAPG